MTNPATAAAGGHSPRTGHATGHSLSARLFGAVGGRVRGRVVLLLASVLGLQGADTGTIGSMAVPLSRAFDVGNAEIGLLVTVTAVVGALATLPAGVLADRVRRVRLLAGAVAVWTVGMLACGLSGSYAALLTSQLALGVVVAVATPVVTSLTGDLFLPGERARIYGFILTGELAGAGVGFAVSGVLSALSWRVPFLVLAVPSLVLAWGLWRGLPEPERGGAGRLVPGARDFDDTVGRSGGEDSGGHSAGGVVVDAVDAAGVRPRAHRVLDTDPRRMSLLAAARHILRVPTNVVLIASSALGYFFLQGLETFVSEYFRGRYSLGQVGATLLVVVIGGGAILGVLSGGRIADHLVGPRRISARPVVAGIAFLAATACLVPALTIPVAAVALPLFFLGTVCYGATNPPLDAARLDTVEPGLWGRAEGVRSVIRRLFESIAPAAFGLVSGWFEPGPRVSGGSAGAGRGVALDGGLPLAHTFLVMLVPLLAAGLLLILVARRTYPADVATTEAAGPPQP